MTVRPGTLDDVEALLSLFDDVAAELVYIGTEPGFDRQRYRAGYLKMIEHPDRTPLFVAVDDGAIAGQLSVFQDADQGPMLGMMVAPGRRRCGIGSALLDAAVEWASGSGAARLSLLVFPHNSAALALYRKYGFVEIERNERDVRRLNGEVWDTMLMRRDIS